MSANGDGQFDIERLERALAALPSGMNAAERLSVLVERQLDRLPLPGQGATLVRWRALGAVASHDLSLAKLYEGHTDALAILAELGEASLAVPGSTWGVWAAEAPNARAFIRSMNDRQVVLDGAKAWCSGAGTASHALLTSWPVGSTCPQQLVAVELRQPGVTVSEQAWQAVGMRESASLDTAFNGVAARAVGAPGAYLSRPGFWHGGAGIAARWYGGAFGLARRLHRAIVKAGPSAKGDFRLAALGRGDVAMQSTAAVLRECAAWIDQHPGADAHAAALRARLAAELTAKLVLDEVGRALGAAAFCRDARFAQAAADLPVYVRQSHAEWDQVALGEAVAQREELAWTL